MGEEEDALFRQLMGEVTPLPADDKAPPATARRPRVGRELLPQVATRTQPLHADGTTLRASGVSQQTARQLASGEFRPEREIDLHGQTRDAAMAALDRFLRQAIADGVRCVSVVHGRGLHSESRRAVLKESVLAWLRAGPLSGHILAVAAAKSSAGGASLLLLRQK